MKKRIEWLDFAKGITIFFVVFGHSLSSIFSSKNVAPFYFNSFISIIFTFIMPCFFAISGYLYKQVHSLNDYILMIRKKSIELGIPYVAFSILYVFMQNISGNSVNTLNTYKDLIFIFTKPIAYLWYLYALFLIFIVIGLLNVFNINDYLILIICVFLTIMYILFPNIFFNGLQDSFSNISYFYIGYIIKKYLNINDKIFKNKNKINTFILFLGFIIFLFLQSFYVIGTLNDGTNFINFPTKVISILLLFQISINIKNNKLFKYFTNIGKYTLIIYLFHGPTISVLRIISFKLIPINTISSIILSLLLFIISWYLSIFMCCISNKIKIINFIFYPFKYINN